MLDIACFAGRMRPFSEAHRFNILQGLDHAQYVFVFIGSTGEPVNFRNPFTFPEVREMIRASLTPAQADRVFIFAVPDHDSDLKWVTEVQRQTNAQIKRLSLGREPKVALIGHSKDDSSYYLKLFPQWGSINTENYGDNLSATDIRSKLYETGDPLGCVEALKSNGEVPAGTYLFLREWVNTDEFETLRGEYRFMQDYLAKFEKNPFTGEDQQFMCADACVIQAGSVLLVRRDRMPGEGLWALPGGHKLNKQTFLQCALDELRQETSISELNPAIDEAYLRRSVKGEKLLDNPYRSTRGTTVSVAYGLLLDGIDQPLVKGTDDAREARWWNLDEVTRAMMFEDHFLIIDDFANRFRNVAY